MSHPLRLLACPALFSIGVLSGCGGGSSRAPTPPAPTAPTGMSQIKHVVIIMQENRTFDNLFNGFPGADTVQSGMSLGQVVPLQPVPFTQGTDIDHSHTAWYVGWDHGALDNFAHAKSYPLSKLPYAYVPQSETVPIWTLAQAYTLGDRMFQSNTGPSFPAHQYMIAGRSQQADENLNGTWGCDATPSTTVALLGPNGTDLPGIYPCFDYQTMADELDAKGITWKYYAAAASESGFIWSGLCANSGSLLACLPEGASRFRATG